MPQDQEGTRIGSDIKVCNKYGRYCIFSSIFVTDETESWIRIVNGIDRFVREAMPIQEIEKAVENPLQKQDQCQIVINK